MRKGARHVDGQVTGVARTLFGREQMVCAIYFEIIIPHLTILMCCVIYDLEGRNDSTNPQDANLTLDGEIYFP